MIEVACALAIGPIAVAVSHGSLVPVGIVNPLPTTIEVACALAIGPIALAILLRSHVPVFIVEALYL